MGQFALLSIDLNDEISEDKWDAFNSVLEGKKWQKVNELSTVWVSLSPDSAGVDAIQETARAHVKEAAEGVGIQSWDAIVHVGQSQPGEFSS